MSTADVALDRLEADDPAGYRAVMAAIEDLDAEPQLRRAQELRGITDHRGRPISALDVEGRYVIFVTMGSTPGVLRVVNVTKIDEGP